MPSLSSGGLQSQPAQLWMGELDQRWDEPTIKQIWSSILGPIGIPLHSIKLIRDKQSLNLGLANAGYCFVRFHNIEDATRVLEEFNGKPIPGTNNLRFFRINWSSVNSNTTSIGSNGNPSISLQGANGLNQPQSFQPGNVYSIFVGDLPQTLTEPILLQTFQSRYPSCSSVKIMIDPMTGNIKGYGFVKFLNEEEHKRALIEMQGYILMGRPIRVSTAVKSQNPNELPTSNYSLGSQPPIQQQQLIVPPLPQSIPLQYYNDPNNTTVFIGGLNVPLSESQLRELFSKYGDITYVKIPPSKNCGFVQYYHRTSAEAAITEMQGYDIGGGCKIRVSWGARAAQRNWFARQLTLQQQVGSAGVNNNVASSPSSSSLLTPSDSISQQELTNSLGLIGTNFNLLNDLLVPGSNRPYDYNLGGLNNVNSFGSNAINSSLNDITLNHEKLNNEQIPFSPVNSSGGGSLENSITSDELKLNEFLLAARDGTLDKLDMSSTVYKMH
ncbi:hypothetical protein CANARDRAFT_232221 [[Candida] arabinofermentans NRRL YB-2248]|uniref:RRM domain-containing protein n=1 Tax=[Candida] arabinofermentans NRRL YB-2248 TaxID=983967 RepID=A0A1E4T430_9ASCO|nr:hypothetical protein CANARDRAFT_232221 [[Candida] arabinofermentans NRRL YB-2248]